MKFDLKFSLSCVLGYKYVFQIGRTRVSSLLRHVSPLYVLFLLFFLNPLKTISQSSNIGQLEQKIVILKKIGTHLSDTAYFNKLIQLGLLYADSNPDSAIALLASVPAQCEKIDYKIGQVNSLNAMGNAWLTKGNLEVALQRYNEAFNLAEKSKLNDAIPGIIGNIAIVYFNKGNYPLSMQKFYESLHLAEKRGDKLLIRTNLNNIGNIQFYQGKMNEAEAAYLKTLGISKQLLDTPNVIISYNNIAEVNVEQNRIKLAIANLSVAYKLATEKNIAYMKAIIANTLGDCYYRLDSLKIAENNFTIALKIGKKTGNARAIVKAEIGLAKLNTKQGLYKIALAYGLDANDRVKKMGQAQLQRDALEVLANVYEKMGDGNSALAYYKKFKQYSDSLINIANERVAAGLKADYQIAKQEEIFKTKTAQQRWWTFSALAGLFSAFVIIFLIYRNKRKLDNTYRQLKEKTAIIEAQKINAEKTLTELKTTQKQLVQNEKMASLGELTAGIAHEIQNPLNFVNNFSEINKELIDEVQMELNAGREAEALLILNDIKGNEEKITFHGKRADAIVKGMLQHSRRSSGEKEPTDINALCDEYLKLAYHGLRAKNKSFNSKLETDFDDSIGKINVVSQDIGRVILNLITNAFYAVEERLGKAAVDSNYKPTVLVGTRLLSPISGSQSVEIKVNDNGSGIPQNIVDKIFQPFFTTKPAGSGTGLGLSMSYDIVRAHGGEIKVESEEAEGTTFTISLPIQ